MAKFRVRARTVDLLGRQQIAGIPTAISELFKNAHDAYAKNVEVDFFRDDGLFVLRDDGLGMTAQEFQDRWLTIGTESKLNELGGLKAPPIDATQSRRPILGEKGIGRLAIAAIGSQVLIVSRARRRGKSSNPVAAFIHWDLFEIPGLDLDEINIPIREVDQGSLPDRAFVQNMLDELGNSLEKLGEKISSAKKKDILSQLKQFDVDPRELDEMLGAPSLTGKGSGTHFFILPSDPLLEADVDDRDDAKKATRLEKNLIGFTNTMTPDHKDPPIIARFRDFPLDEGGAIERIGEKAFFTPEEFRKADHHFKGTFDENGQFVGTVSVYQKDPVEYVLNWSDYEGKRTLCGPFDFNFAYVQGVATQSLLPPAEHVRIKRKLERMGGLYIYRDGVRILPYGDSDYDWLDVERRRTLGAGYYFYSYRRMFGVIELSRQENTSLSEKAGREGFRENKAYRQLRSILTNFLIQTAGDFFREDGARADAYATTLGDLKKKDEIRKLKAKQSRKRQSELEIGLDAFFESVDSGTPELESENILGELKGKVARLLRNDSSKSTKASKLIALEKTTKEKLKAQRTKHTLTKPRGVGLTSKVSNRWANYLEETDRLTRDVFDKNDLWITNFIAESASDNDLPIDHLQRIETEVSVKTTEVTKKARRLKKENDELADEIRTRVLNDTKLAMRSMEQLVKDAADQLALLKNNDIPLSESNDLRHEVIGALDTGYEEQRSKLERMQEQLQSVQTLWAKGAYTSSELTEAMEEELELLREQHNTDIELAQVGQAITAVGHEFEKVVNILRDSFRRLKSWADQNPDLKDLYEDMRNSFDHLDGYLTLFTPFDRRLHRRARVIQGKELAEFLEELFAPRLTKYDIKLKASPAFHKARITGYPSDFFPVFVNIVDNSIFWLQRVRGKQREISLDAKGKDIYIKDNGPGISAGDRTNIFKLHFSRKPGGQGMGLYISKETLNRAGYDLHLEENTRNGAVLKISPN